MGIAKDIHQTKFRNERHKALINLLFTYGWAVEHLKEFVSEEGITHQQFNILRILRGNHPTPLSTLSIRERMIDKMSDTSRIVDRPTAAPSCSVGLANRRIPLEGRLRFLAREDGALELRQAQA